MYLVLQAPAKKEETTEESTTSMAWFESNPPPSRSEGVKKREGVQQKEQASQVQAVTEERVRWQEGVRSNSYESKLCPQRIDFSEAATRAESIVAPRAVIATIERFYLRLGVCMIGFEIFNQISYSCPGGAAGFYRG